MGEGITGCNFPKNIEFLSLEIDFVLGSSGPDAFHLGLYYLP